MKKGLMVTAACTMASSAFAATPETTATDPFVQQNVVLHLDGLDLATVDGQKRLAIRMDNAARAVCGEGLDKVHLAAARQARECEVAVKADIRDQIEQRMAANGGSARLASAR
ncbi:UrcA family protein [Croceicoccus mobilis]|nr:UrcA family protein [Croceicoccus mobilis]